ncbi:MAG: hypothetical protein JW741_22260 [Sedimentisphaerales bacterium]|nr:hypothetical protein [Sedimentisphaerales bacterium]
MTRSSSQLSFVLALTALLTSAGLTEPAETTSEKVAFWVPQHPPRARYQIDCTIELADKVSLEGQVTIHLVNTTPGPLQTLAIDWMKFGEQTLRIEANGKPVDLPAPIRAFPQDFVLPEPVRPGQPLTLEVEFALSVPAPPQEMNRMGPIDKWPGLWWGMPTQDDYELKLDAPDGYAVVTSGRLDPETGSYRARSIPSFGLVLLKGHEVLEDRTGDVVVRCLYKPEDVKCAKLLLETAVDVIDFYRDWLGFYPYRVLNIIPGMDRPAGGYPAATNIIVIHGMGRMDDMPELHWRWITAHEIGHQYWGRHVMEKDDPGWLWIGLGIYADRQYCRARNLGSDKHEQLMERYIRGVREGLDTTVSRSQEERSNIKFDFNNVVIHGKGFSIISALDCMLGKATFEQIYRRCLHEFAGRPMGLQEFRAFCERETGQDLGWFFEQWVNSNKVLSYEIASQTSEKKDDAYVTEVEVRCLGTLKMPVPVTARFEDGTSQQAATERLHDVDVLRFKSRAPLKDVQLDPEKALPLVVPPPSAHDQELARTMQELPWVGAGEKALEVFEKAQQAQMSDAGRWFKLGMALYDGKYYEQALTAFRTSQRQAQDDPSRACAALVWQGHLLDLLERRDEALRCYNEALGQSADLNMRHDQYGMKLDRQWVQKRIEEPFRRE